MTGCSGIPPLGIGNIGSVCLLADSFQSGDSFFDFLRQIWQKWAACFKFARTSLYCIHAVQVLQMSLQYVHHWFCTNIPVGIETKSYFGSWISRLIIRELQRYRANLDWNFITVLYLLSFPCGSNIFPAPLQDTSATDVVATAPMEVWFLNMLGNFWGKLDVAASEYIL